MTLPVLAGCTGTGGSASSVVVLRIDTPVHEAVWSDHAQALLALTETGSRIAKIDPFAPSGSPNTTLSGSFSDVGENIATSPTDNDVVYLPQPKLDRVAVVSIGDLRQLETLQAGPAPSYVDKDSGSKVLLAASEDGSAVTGVDLQDHRVFPSQNVGAGPEAEVDGAKRGRLVEYHVAGPQGVVHYKGGPMSVKQQAAIAISASSTASDLVKPSRLYVAEHGTDRLLAVDSQRTHQGLEVVAETRLGQPVHYLGVDETRIYAATEHKLVVLETNSFVGYPDNTFPIVVTIDFRTALQEEAKSAPLSGLAVGPDRVYLTLKGQPYVVSVAKPSI